MGTWLHILLELHLSILQYQTGNTFARAHATCMHTHKAKRHKHTHTCIHKGRSKHTKQQTYKQTNKQPRSNQEAKKQANETYHGITLHNRAAMNTLYNTKTTRRPHHNTPHHTAPQHSTTQHNTAEHTARHSAGVHGTTQNHMHDTTLCPTARPGTTQHSTAQPDRLWHGRTGEDSPRHDV